MLSACADAVATIVATGSEVELAINAAAELATKNIQVNVVSMPCMERFIRSDSTYQQQVLPTGIPTFAIEAGASMPWFRFATSAEHIIAIDSFGASAPIADLFNQFGFYHRSNSYKNLQYIK